MLDPIIEASQLSVFHFWIAVAVVFFAGMVRGFSGFALSALIMASLALIIPPVELIAVCFMLELTASMMMIRGGFKDGDVGIAGGLTIGSAIGSPIGLYLTTTLPVDISKLVALLVVLSLAALQLFRVKASFLATKPGLYLSGVTAGLATGLASVGGMVVALYVLARDAPAAMMRGSLVLYLFMASLFSGGYMWLYGLFTEAVIVRGMAFIIPCILGVFVGKALFTPRLEPYYKPFCLVLLMVLAGSGIVRLTIGS